MLFRIQKKKRKKSVDLERVAPMTLRDLGLRESDLQAMLFDNLPRVIRQEELLPIAQSRKWQEEPDIIAVDKAGRIYLFELKAWESKKENLLQVMRYAQIFSSYDYNRLAHFWQTRGAPDLATVHQEHFELDALLAIEKWNHAQTLIVMTNGLDHETREAVRYWKKLGVDIRPWIYRVYRVGVHKFIAFEAFGAEDDPYEDAESRFHIVNTNMKDGPEGDEYMLREGRAAAFCDPWKYSIENVGKNDFVFLYRSREGLVGYGKAKLPHGIRPHDDDEEYYVDLQGFKRIDPVISYSELCQIAGYDVPVRRTYTSISKEAGKGLIKHLKNRKR